MTSQKNRDTSSAIVCGVCACACAGRRYGLLLRKKRCWMGSLFFIKQSRRTVEQITVAWDQVIFGGHIVYHTSPFCVGIVKAVDDLRPYE